MGLKINALLIDPDEPLRITSESSQTISSFKIKQQQSDLSPSSLNIGFYKERIVILNEPIVEYILNDDTDLHPLEKEIIEVYPKSGILHIHQFDTIGFIGYCLIQDKQKIRTKAVVEGKLYLDQGELLQMEKMYAENMIKALKKNNSKYLENTLENFKVLSKNDQYKEFLYLREKLLKDGSMGYLNGGIDEEIAHMFLGQFTESDWSKLTELNYVAYKGVSVKQKEIKLIEYIHHAYLTLKNS